MLALALQPNDPAFPSIVVLPSVDGRSEAAVLSSVFFIMFPVKVNTRDIFKAVSYDT